MKQKQKSIWGAETYYYSLSQKWDEIILFESARPDEGIRKIFEVRGFGFTPHSHRMAEYLELALYHYGYGKLNKDTLTYDLCHNVAELDLGYTKKIDKNTYTTPDKVAKFDMDNIVGYNLTNKSPEYLNRLMILRLFILKNKPIYGKGLWIVGESKHIFRIEKDGQVLKRLCIHKYDSVDFDTYPERVRGLWNCCGMTIGLLSDTIRHRG